MPIQPVHSHVRTISPFSALLGLSYEINRTFPCAWSNPPTARTIACYTRHQYRENAGEGGTYRMETQCVLMHTPFTTTACCFTTPCVRLRRRAIPTETNGTPDVPSQQRRAQTYGLQRFGIGVSDRRERVPIAHPPRVVLAVHRRTGRRIPSAIKRIHIR
jgi:hypothetical protein